MAEKIGQKNLREINLNLVLTEIRKVKAISRTELARKTGLSAATITRVVKDLNEYGFVCDDVVKAGNIGRASSKITLNGQLFYSCCICIQKNYISVGLMDFSGKLILTAENENVLNVFSAEMVVLKAREMFLEMLKDVGINEHEVHCLGVCCDGAVNRENGVVMYAPSLLWTEVNLGKICADVFGISCVVVENDVRAALIGETVESAEKLDNVGFLSVDYCMQCAVICDGNLVGGFKNSAGAVGHVAYDNCGEVCDCGRIGCLNTIISEKNIVKKARLVEQEVLKVDEVMMAFNMGCEWAKPIVLEISTGISFAINNILCLYNPEKIVVGGRFFKRYRFLFEHIKKIENRNLYKALAKDVRIEMAQFSGNEGLFGVAGIAIDARLQEIIKKGV